MPVHTDIHESHVAHTHTYAQAHAHMHPLTFACTNMHANKLTHTLPHVIHVQTHAHTFAPLCMHTHTHTCQKHHSAQINAHTWALVMSLSTFRVSTWSISRSPASSLAASSTGLLDEQYVQRPNTVTYLCCNYQQYQAWSEHSSPPPPHWSHCLFFFSVQLSHTCRNRFWANFVKVEPTSVFCIM